MKVEQNFEDPVGKEVVQIVKETLAHEAGLEPTVDNSRPKNDMIETSLKHVIIYFIFSTNL